MRRKGRAAAKYKHFFRKNGTNAPQTLRLPNSAE